MTDFSRRSTQSGEGGQSETVATNNTPTADVDDDVDDDDALAEEDDLNDELSDALTDL